MSHLVPDPPLTYRTTDKILVVGSLVLFVGAALIYYLKAVNLPEIVALQYGEDGVPHRFSNPNEMLLVPGVLGVVMLALLALSRVPHLYSYPCEITQSNYRKVYTTGRELILVAAFFIAVLLNVVLSEFFYAIEYQKPFPFWVFLSVTLVLVIIWPLYLIKLSRMKG